MKGSIYMKFLLPKTKKKEQYLYEKVISILFGKIDIFDEAVVNLG